MKIITPKKRKAKFIFAVKRFYNNIKITAKILLAKDLRELVYWASFRFDCRQRMRKAYQRLGFVKNGNLNLNAESNDSKVVAFPANRVAGLACAA